MIPHREDQQSSEVPRGQSAQQHQTNGLHIYGLYMYYSYFTSVLLTVNSMMHFSDQWIDSLSNMDLMFGAFSLIVLFMYSVPAAGGEHHHFCEERAEEDPEALSSDYPECLESQREDEEVLDGEDEEQRRSSREAFLNITLHFLRSMKQEELADRLQSSKRVSIKI
ncbi:hypothetical protein F7725_023605 [Dissostichus mawsoni]|uniref:Uncharacterized protein n=1 Tax=Dissostichus mawsoni TaxID=36200 RepID=A0A7J5XX00_DISMA|nr:hypothetical protein F7725_023605 [Dissostichus mawsoni]